MKNSCWYVDLQSVSHIGGHLEFLKFLNGDRVAPGGLSIWTLQRPFKDSKSTENNYSSCMGCHLTLNVPFAGTDTGVGAAKADSTYLFVPVAVELVELLDHMGNSRAISYQYLVHRISVTVQWGNAVSVAGLSGWPIGGVDRILVLHYYYYTTILTFNLYTIFIIMFVVVIIVIVFVDCY